MRKLSNKICVLPLRIFVYTGVLLALFQVACAQRGLTEVVSKDEISIEFQHPAKIGETRKYTLNLKDVPNGQRLPNAYKLIENRTYYIKTETIDLGDSRISFKVPINNEEEFKKVRVLRLTKNEMTPGGYEWRDCTVLPLAIELQHIPDNLKSSPEYKESLDRRGLEESPQIPNFSKQTVACKFNDVHIQQDEYFSIVVETQPPPTKPFTDLKLTVDSEQWDSKHENVTYRITFKNTGTKDIGELIFRSSFQIDTTYVSVKPERGKCIFTKYSSGGAICFMGDLPVDASVSAELKGVPSGMSGTVNPERPNLYWDVDVDIKEHPDDPIWTSNRISFRPFGNK